ncbi:hypothetical protein BH24DEI1_BH24DEI1_17280 [soil metagenome]|jgi:hypothetical protein|nr:BrnA antitoxin family protein [Deinococcota bacterium]
MKDAKTSVSQASSYQEIGDYWDAHDLGDIWERTKAVAIEVGLASSVRYYPLERGLSERLRDLAKERGVSPETLLNLWLQEKMREEAVR